MGNTDMTNEYQIALAKVTAASAKFRTIQLAYRTRQIGDVEFLEGKRIMVAADREFDAIRGEAA